MKATSLLERMGVCASLLVLGLILCFGATPAWTQATSSSSVVGQITDPTGAAIPAACGPRIKTNSLQFLPNMGRDVSPPAVLQPAVTANGFTAGAYMDQNPYKLDGGNISDDMAGNTIGYQTNFPGLGGTQTSAF